MLDRPSIWWVSFALGIAARSVFAQPAPEAASPPESVPATPSPINEPAAAAEPELPAPPPPPAVAQAEPPPRTPTATITATPAPKKDRYPRSLSMRRPILPKGVVEASALFGMQMLDSSPGRGLYTAMPRLRVGIPRAELQIASTVLVHQASSAMADPQRLGSVLANGRYMFFPGATIGAELGVRDPALGSRRYSPRLLVGMKQRLGTRGAVDLTLGGGLDQARTSGETTRTLAAVSVVRIQAQMATGLAFEARHSVGYFKRLDDDPIMPVGAFFAQDYGLRMVAAANPYVDFIAGFDVLGSGANAYQLITAGIAVRRVP